MTARERVERARRLLLGAAWARSVGQAVGVAGLVLAVWRVATGGWPAGAWVSSVVAAALVTWWVLHRRGASHLTIERTALWVEERHPELSFALVSAAGTSAPRDALEQAASTVDWSSDVRIVVRRGVIRGALSLLAGVALVWIASRITLVKDRETVAPHGQPTATPGQAGPLTFTAVVRPPAYTGLSAVTFESPASLNAVAGSEIELDVTGSAVRFDGVSVSSLPSDRDGRTRGRVIMPSTATALRIIGGGGGRILALLPIRDSVPHVTLTMPARDTVVREVPTALPLVATVTDDFGVSNGWFDYIVSSGEGESFTFRAARVGAQRFNGRHTDLTTVLPLADLGLKPGDIVHVRALARDRNNVSGPGEGASETRTIRVAKAAEYDSVAVEGAAPPETGKSLLSQRMIINMTEVLIARARRLAASEVTAESRRIAREQSRLRHQVSDIIFARLGADASGEHAHNEGEIDEDRPLTKEELLRAAEAATSVRSEPLDFAHDETPVVAINRPLLEAYNAMWDAGRELGVAAPRRALPHMYRALEAIQRARAAERLYLRGKAPLVVVDLARVRLAGTERGAPTMRTPRRAVDLVRDSARVRFRRAMQLLEQSSPAAIDSLLLVRLAVVGVSDSAAVALDAAIAALRQGDDATEPLRRVRQTLDARWRTADSLSRWRGGPP